VLVILAVAMLLGDYQAVRVNGQKGAAAHEFIQRQIQQQQQPQPTPTK
jgi:hypothetical protein